MTLKRLFWLALYFLMPILPIALIRQSPVGQAQDPLYILSVVTGACAFVWLVNQLIISARPKFIEKHFGMDRLYRFHAWMAVISLGLVIVHRQTKLAWIGFAPSTAQIAAILFILAVLFALIFLADTALRKLTFIRAIINFSNQKLGVSFNRAVLFHNITVIASLVMALHVLATGAAGTYPPVRIFYLGYFSLGAGFYVYHKLIKPWRLNRLIYQVESVTEELPNIRTIKLTPPSEREILTYQPGQFAFITPLGGEVAREEHPFTISSSPVNPSGITFTIKELGDFTARLGKLQTGSPFRVDAPYGYFSYTNYPSDRSLVFIAGGIGITPILSMLRTLRESTSQRQVVFLWAVNQASELFCQDELKTMMAQMPSFTWHPIVAFDDTWDGESGFVDKDKIQRLVLNPRADQQALDYYICGPPVMMKLVIGHLKDLGVPADCIRSERFSL